MNISIDFLLQPEPEVSTLMLVGGCAALFVAAVHLGGWALRLAMNDRTAHKAPVIVTAVFMQLLHALLYLFIAALIVNAIVQVRKAITESTSALAEVVQMQKSILDAGRSGPIRAESSFIGAKDGAPYLSEEVSAQLRELTVEVSSIRTDLSETRLRLGEVESPFLSPERPLSGRDHDTTQPPAGAAQSPEPAPAGFSPDAPFTLLSVRRLEGDAHAYVQMPGEEHHRVLTTEAPVTGWLLLNVNVADRTALFQRQSDLQLINLQAQATLP